LGIRRTAKVGKREKLLILCKKGKQCNNRRERVLSDRKGFLGADVWNRE
jgi:hypothetical protein